MKYVATDIVAETDENTVSDDDNTGGNGGGNGNTPSGELEG